MAGDPQSTSHTVESLVLVGVLTVSDRASAGRYEDRGGPAVVAHLERRLAPGWRAERRVVADELDDIAAALGDLVARPCALVVTTGGTGVGVRDVTPEATRRVCDRLVPGFGEAMRADSRHETPLAILSRAEAGVAGRALVVNLPGSPRAVATCLDAVLPAVPHLLSQIGAPPLALRDADPRAQDAHGG